VTGAGGPVVIAGGSGFLGVSLATHLAGLGRPVVILSRRPPAPTAPGGTSPGTAARPEPGPASWTARAAW